MILTFNSCTRQKLDMVELSHQSTVSPSYNSIILGCTSTGDRGEGLVPENASIVVVCCSSRGLWRTPVKKSGSSLWQKLLLGLLGRLR